MIMNKYIISRVCYYRKKNYLFVASHGIFVNNCACFENIDLYLGRYQKNKKQRVMKWGSSPRGGKNRQIYSDLILNMMKVTYSKMPAGLLFKAICIPFSQNISLSQEQQ